MTLQMVRSYLHLFFCIFQCGKLFTQFVKYWINSEDTVTHLFAKAFLHWDPPISHSFLGVEVADA
jgi:hypothetical protein